MIDPPAVTKDVREARRYCKGARAQAPTEKRVVNRRARRSATMQVRAMCDWDNFVLRVKRLTGWELT